MSTKKGAIDRVILSFVLCLRLPLAISCIRQTLFMREQKILVRPFGLVRKEQLSSSFVFFHMTCSVPVSVFYS